MLEFRFINTPSGHLHGVVGGEGDALILVHGFGDFNTWRTWERNVDALSMNFRVYALELLGYGESDEPEPRLDALGQANALVQLLDAESHARAHFLGLSWGGDVVQNIALHAPERVNKIVLVDSLFDSSEEGLARVRKIGAPTLIVWDEDDAMIPAAWAPILHMAIPHSRLEIFRRTQRDPDANPQNRHWTQMSHSRLFNRVVTDFLLEQQE